MSSLCVARLRLLSEDPVDLVGSPLNALCAHLERLLTYDPGERDAIFLHHLIGIEWPDKQVCCWVYTVLAVYLHLVKVVSTC